MNCQEFENGLDALARGSLADARTRTEASAHADACARCAARLADERALTEGLRAMASRLKAAQAPPRVESALLTTLRARAAAAAASAEPAARDNNSTLAGSADARRWSLTKTVAVAALAAAAAVAFFMLIPPGMSVPPAQKAGEVAGTQAARESNPGAPAAQEPEQSDVQTADAAEGASQTTPPASTVSDENRLQRAALASRALGRARASEASFNSVGTRGVAQARRGGDVDAGVEEITTDFIPLMQGGRFAQGEGGHLVRVELPRSALTSFGLPVNAEAAGGRVKADVLLGEDGLARAIRFVR